MENFSTTPRPAAQEAQPVGLSTGNHIVDAVTQMRFEGNIVDHRWFLSPELKAKSGLINGTAIHVLADIVFWHTAILNRNHATQVIEGVSKRFSGPQFWQAYEVWARGLGLTPRQLRDAVAFLHKKQIIHRRTGQVRLASGVKTANVAIIVLNVEKLHEITYGTPSPRRSKREVPHVKTSDAPRSDVRPPTPQREITNREHAETTQEPTTTEANELLMLLLTAKGVQKTRAKTLATDHAHEMRRRLEYLPFIPNVKSAGALLSARPEEAWSEPASYRSAAAQQAQNQQKNDAEAADRETQRQKTNERAEKEQENKMLDEKFAALSAGEQRSIDDEAADRVNRLKLAGFNVRGALAAARRNIMRRELGLPVEDLEN